MTIGTWDMTLQWITQSQPVYTTLTYWSSGATSPGTISTISPLWSMCGNTLIMQESGNYTYTGTYSGGTISGTMTSSGGNSGWFTMIQSGTSTYGCTDPTACNYNAAAVIDDGTCSGILGCMDTLAYNYNTNATCPGSCNYQMTYVPDDYFEQRLINLGYDNVLDDSVLTANINTVDSLNVSNSWAWSQISDLTGIEAFTALTYLNCYDNQLTSLDLSQNTALTYLNCSYNQLTSLDVSANTALTYLMCRNNQLTSLDVSTNTALTNLYCYYNQLTSLDLSQNTALTYLNCSYNQLTSLDVSANTALTYLMCRNNQLTSLDVSTNTALTNLYCYYNQLTSLDVSTNTALTDLSCASNQLTSLDVSNNTALIELYCTFNQLTSLDASGCTATDDVTITVNPVPSVTISALPTPACVGDNIVITAATSIPVNRYRFQYNTGSGWVNMTSPGFDTINPVTFFNISTTTQFRVKVREDNGCTNSSWSSIITVPINTIVTPPISHN